MKIITYNVNGIRAAIKKGFFEWMKAVDADIILIQETKAQPDQIPTLEFESMGYKCYWHSAVKKGYSGVGILTKVEPKNIQIGIGVEKFDYEGRMIRADFDDFSVASIYHPSGSSGDIRQEFKMEWLDAFKKHSLEIKKEIPNLILSGDYNICHEAIDIHDPVRNAKNSGFLPEEREWLTGFLNNGFIDSFRHLNKEPHHYSWWTYRANARANNKGWRIDYHLITDPIESNLKRSIILPDAMHSDHCPVLIEMEF